MEGRTAGLQFQAATRGTSDEPELNFLGSGCPLVAAAKQLPNTIDQRGQNIALHLTTERDMPELRLKVDCMG